MQTERRCPGRLPSGTLRVRFRGRGMTDKIFLDWHDWYNLQEDLKLHLDEVKQDAVRTNVDAEGQTRLALIAKHENIRRLQKFLTDLDPDLSHQKDISIDVIEKLNELIQEVERENSALGNAPLHNYTEKNTVQFDNCRDKCDHQNQTDEFNNYFKLIGDNWRVKFKGSKEINIKATKPIRTLVEYLRNPHKPLNRADLQLQLYADPANNQSGKTQQPIMADNYGTNKNNSCDVNEALTPEVREATEKEAMRLHVEIEAALKQGKDREEDTKSNIEKYEKLQITLQREYNAKLDNKGKIAWNIIKDKTEIHKMSQLTQKELARAVKSIKKHPELKDLAAHLEKYLIKNRDCYRPPPDFPDWHICT